MEEEDCRLVCEGLNTDSVIKKMISGKFDCYDEQHFEYLNSKMFLELKKNLYGSSPSYLCFFPLP